LPTRDVITSNYNVMLIKEYLREHIKDAGFGGFEMAKRPTGTRVTLHVTRPGIVIGRKGVGIKEITDVLAERFGLKDPQITVSELEKPELSPNVMCNRIATHISRGISFRRATMWTLRQIMEGGAMGVQITVSGKLRGDRSAFEKHTQGILPRAGHSAAMIVSEDIAHVKTPMGLIGVRVRIAKKNAVPAEFEHKGKAKKPEAEPKAEEASAEPKAEQPKEEPKTEPKEAEPKAEQPQEEHKPEPKPEQAEAKPEVPQ